MKLGRTNCTDQGEGGEEGEEGGGGWRKCLFCLKWSVVFPLLAWSCIENERPISHSNLEELEGRIRMGGASIAQTGQIPHFSLFPSLSLSLALSRSFPLFSI